MAHRSEKTFQEEEDRFRNIPGVFWDSPYDYPGNPFGGIMEELGGHEAIGLNPVDSDSTDLGGDAPEFWGLGATGLSVLNRRGLLVKLGRAAGKDDASFAEAFWDLLGVDIEEEIQALAASGRFQDPGKLGALTAKFGTDAFATYCPWHACFRSSGTPWGIYMFLEKLLDWACLLHASGEFLPNPKPALIAVFRLLWYLTYRHELFHFHVELFAARLESALRKPVYRPYVTYVRTKVANGPEWWEEALAQAVVLRSTMVKRALAIDSSYLNRYVVPYFRTFPEGYKRFECKGVSGGLEGAHETLSAQIARAQVAIPLEERNTAIALAKSEYRVKDDSVPGYLILRSTFRSRFQLQTPRLRETLRHIERIGRIVPGGKGDHYKIEIAGQSATSTKRKLVTRSIWPLPSALRGRWASRYLISTGRLHKPLSRNSRRRVGWLFLASHPVSALSAACF
jgi:hypothetical protein